MYVLQLLPILCFICAAYPSSFLNYLLFDTLHLGLLYHCKIPLYLSLSGLFLPMACIGPARPMLAALPIRAEYLGKIYVPTNVGTGGGMSFQKEPYTFESSSIGG
ncbi:hypothetical protein GGR54DRAFT_624841 [Hypoxylon sp. NC1633]|nr:hypothetical protein GGR54DRAFT_624841 [Hypoxylon sp. NC1633]